MCGIAGVYCYRNGSEQVSPAELLSIRDSMQVRGPDGAGVWISQDMATGLAHRRLSIIDLSNEASQPMATSDERLRIVFNGEIYNYQELRKELEEKGFRLHTHSDTEVLLGLYRFFGTDMVHRLRGMYAFAIWDEDKRGLLLVRDPLGIKPLYYSDNGTTVRFASQVKALIRSPHVDTAPDSAGHVGFFLWGSVPEPYTLYKGIRSLPAGSTMWIDTSGARLPAVFYNIAAALSGGEKSDKEYTRESDYILREALLDSVRHHLVADVPVGMFLSAGLDSTTLTALATELSGVSLRTVTLGFEEYRGTANDETVLARLAAEQYQTSHQTRWVRQEDFQSEREKLLTAMDQPTLDGVNTYFVSKAAAESGLKVAISGLGGDELFAGYPSFREIPRMVKTFSIFRRLKTPSRVFRYLSAPLLKRFTSPKYAGLLEYGGTFGGAYLLRRGLFMPWELPEILGSDITREGWRELQPLARLDASVLGSTNDRARVSALEMTWYMRNQLLRDADWAGMAHSLEIRVPFVDIELIRRTASILSANFPGKQDMAQTPRTPLPNAILARDKTGFSVPVRDWLAATMDDPAGERGLRGWARQIYHAQTAIIE